jgi:hypothetical protein
MHTAEKIRTCSGLLFIVFMANASLVFGSSRLLKKSISATVGALYERPLFVESRKYARS